MRVLRRVVFPIVWLLIFSVIAVALVKIAFIDGLKDESEQLFPNAQIQAPVIDVARGTVTNTVELTGTVQSDAGVPVRSTAAGKVVFFFVNKGATVLEGERLYQIRSEVTPDPVAVVSDEKDSEESSQPAPGPVYSYTDVLAPTAGTLETLTVLLDQETSVGETTGSVVPGTFSITGALTTAQQFRLMGRPSVATGTITNGPAPFSCQNVQLSNAPAENTGGNDADQANANMMGAVPAEASSGQVSCSIPAEVEVFPGLGAGITLTAGEAKDVLALPLTAVKGSVKNGIVWIQSAEGGEPVEREVVLGLNDGNQVEIASGLKEGEQVLEFVPGSDAAVPNGQMPGYPMMGG